MKHARRVVLHFRFLEVEVLGLVVGDASGHRHNAVAWLSARATRTTCWPVKMADTIEVEIIIFSIYSDKNAFISRTHTHTFTPKSTKTCLYKSNERAKLLCSAFAR